MREIGEYETTDTSSSAIADNWRNAWTLQILYLPSSQPTGWLVTAVALAVQEYARD